MNTELKFKVVIPAAIFMLGMFLAVQRGAALRRSTLTQPASLLRRPTAVGKTRRSTFRTQSMPLQAVMRSS